MRLALLSLALLCSVAAPAADIAVPPAPVYRGQIVLPTGLKVAGAEFGGISGLDYDPAADVFYAISDDRSEKAPARFYALKMALGTDGISGLDIAESHVLLALNGKPFAPRTVDPEAVRLVDGRLLWASEGDATGRPSITKSDLSGKGLGVFKLPDAYLPTEAGGSGVRGNLGFEGLTLSPDGKTLYAATESALIQDGDKASLTAGSPARLLVLDLDSGNATAEHVYQTDRIPNAPTLPAGSADNGVSEILALDADRLIVVERSYVAGVGNRIAFYVVSLPGAEDVSGRATIAGARPLPKALWFKIDEGDFGGLDIDNIEAASFGPEIGGEHSLVLASDNNFNRQQISQFLLFTIPKTAP
ncbi:hypothetical protein Sa4125_42870 [Aureimonas sp. SA4125]|uniref:esterase-like activity of phytase family protein n=1 Tax=Aureimonas sp. SA4125 TaxID=2826993 RepID=UPI001CC61B57|nr:esterase-like activity of phytase family protein [Aureimonas sp. SA4125]BDA86745.1 hypothetical protein Sa4125_42870 [Aureimonas sp. SA4125]